MPEVSVPEPSGDGCSDGCLFNDGGDTARRGIHDQIRGLIYERLDWVSSEGPIL